MHTAKGTTIRTAAAGSMAADLGAAVPVFGLIGQQFLASYAQALASHVGSANELATVHDGLAAAGQAGLATYHQTDDGSGAKFNSLQVD